MFEDMNKSCSSNAKADSSVSDTLPVSSSAMEMEPSVDIQSIMPDEPKKQSCFGFYLQENNTFYTCQSQEEFHEFQRLLAQPIGFGDSENDLSDHEIWSFFEPILRDQIFSRPSEEPVLRDIL